jgi:tetratricopeptide (TPR) repeat protein
MSAKTVNAEPNNSTYLDTYAWIFYKQGNYNLAKIYITKAVDNVKETEGSEVILEHAGDIYAAVNENDKALEMWTKALNINDKNDALKAKIEKLKKTIEK